jgi:branched-chain amino acid aminotransferase
MGLFEAYERGGETVVLTDGQGHVTEGPGFNVFGVFGQGEAARIVTAATGVLEGVTRKTVIEMAQALGHAVEQRPWTVDELRRADEVFLSSSGGGVITISQVDGVAVAGRPAGQPGPVTAALQARYWALHDDERHNEAVQGLDPAT